MIARTFEVRDRATFIPMLAVKLEPDCEADRYLLERAGYGDTAHDQAQYVMLWNLDGGDDQATIDPYKWRNRRTRQTAHAYIIQHWDDIASGNVIDVEYILGETPHPKRSEAASGL